MSSKASVEIAPAAPDERSILANLIELYAHDFSEFHDIDLGADGRFGYNELPLYWSEPNRHPFLLRVNGNLAGFVLVRRGSKVSGNKDTWDMAEFFVVRRYRRLGAGTQAAHHIWQRFQGPWEVRVSQSNQPALTFWQKAIGAFEPAGSTSTHVDRDGKCWTIYSFESRPLL